METQDKNNLTILTGGESITVRHINDNGEVTLAEVIKIRLIRVKDYPALGAAIGDDCKLAELVCGMKEGWSHDLHPDDHMALLAKAREVNKSFFAVWLPRRLEQAKELLGEQFDRVTNSVSSNTSPSSPRRPVEA